MSPITSTKVVAFAAAMSSLQIVVLVGATSPMEAFHSYLPKGSIDQVPWICGVAHPLFPCCAIDQSTSATDSRYEHKQCVVGSEWGHVVLSLFTDYFGLTVSGILFARSV